MKNLTKQQEEIIKGKVCPYCKCKTEFVDSSVIYSRSYGMVYLCKKCNAYVGCHKGTDKALGRLANKSLREAKKEAHRHFDVIWKEKHLTRNEAYLKLSNYLGLPPKYTHIGMFREDTCKKVIEFSKAFLADLQ